MIATSGTGLDPRWAQPARDAAGATLAVLGSSLVALFLPFVSFAAPVPAALESRVRIAVAERWSVAADAVRLEWPRATVPDSVPADAAIAIAGEARDGWLVVRAGSGPGALALRVRAGTLDSVTVAARPLAPGDRIGAGDVRREPRVGWGPPAPDAEAVTGWEVRRALAEGEVLAPPAVRPPLLIAPGDPVRVSWARGEVRLALAGIALNGARRGEPLRVRVEGRPAPLAAFASGPGAALLESGGER